MDRILEELFCMYPEPNAHSLKLFKACPAIHPYALCALLITPEDVYPNQKCYQRHSFENKSKGWNRDRWELPGLR